MYGEHSAILSTFVKLSFVIKIFVLSILSGRFTQILLYFVYQSTRLDVSYIKGHTCNNQENTWSHSIQSAVRHIRSNEIYYVGPNIISNSK